MWPKRKEDTEQLYADTRTLLENFKPSKVSAYITSTVTDQSAQSAVYAIVNEGNEMAGKIKCHHVCTMYSHVTVTCAKLGSLENSFCSPCGIFNDSAVSVMHNNNSVHKNVYYVDSLYSSICFVTQHISAVLES